MTDAVRLLSAAFGFLLFLSACTVDTPPAAMVPTGPSVTRIEDLSGQYCYVGPDFNIRTYGRSSRYFPFVQVNEMASPTVVSVRASRDRIVFRYTAVEGAERVEAFDVLARGAKWKGSALVVGSSNYWGLLGLLLPRNNVSVASHEGRAFKLKDGRLVLSDTYRDKGLVDTDGSDHFYRTENSVVVILDPIVGSCGGEAAVPARKAWFDRGPDLRSPACAAALVEQLASILAEKGQAPEAAAALASGTVNSFSGGSDASSFLVSTDSGSTYCFRVSKVGTACTLNLHYRRKQTEHSTSGWPSNASRSLLPCACND